MGVSVILSSRPEWASIFYEEEWFCSTVLELYTGTSEPGFGWYKRGHWSHGNRQKHFMELLYVMVIALFIKGRYLLKWVSLTDDVHL